MKNLHFKFKDTLKVFFTVSILALAVSGSADDTEIYYSVNVSKPNVLFVMDNSGSMRWDLQGNEPYEPWDSTIPNPNFSGTTRMSVMKNALKTVLSSKNADGDYNVNNANIGIMRYGPAFNQVTLQVDGKPAWDYYGEAWSNNENHRSHGIHGVALPVTDINAPIRNVLPTNADTYFLPNLGDEFETVRDYMGKIIDDWQPSGGTPIVGALYEAALYFRGEKMHYGQNSPTHSIADNIQSVVQAAHPSTYINETIISPLAINYLQRNSSGTVIPRDHSSAPNYNSPIVSHCQSNYIVLMSDGRPTYYYSNPVRNGAWDKGPSPLSDFMRGDSNYSQLAANLPECTGTGFRADSGRCGPELTKYLAENDNSTQHEEEQPIETFSIGLGGTLRADTQEYLKDIATFNDPNTPEGPRDDGYFAAESPEELAAAFADILSKIGKPAGSLASPGYSVNVKSGLEHEKDIYVPVFDRKNSSRWSGNIKKFKIVDDSGLRKLRGKNDLDAFDELGGFTHEAHDYWSDNVDADGSDVEKGGISNKLDDPTSRLLVSNITNNKNLTASANLINPTNFASLSNADLGVSNDKDENYRKRLAHYIRGWKNGVEDSTATRHMGDMLHSEPVVITYKNADENGVGKKQYIFALTNEGYLHAFDTSHEGSSVGKEMFAFMPKELFKNIEGQMLNTGTQKDHKYGLDGTISYWLKEGITKNNVLDPGEKLYLYFGMRRGGSSYYALDITDIENPKLLWKKSSADYPSMGQSWSPPYLAKVGKSGSTCNNGRQNNCKEVMIISGGYDEDEDRDRGGRVFCAKERRTCTLPVNKTATVWYGANSTWVSKKNVTGSIACNNSVFGDPLFGVFKSCKYEINDGEYDSTLTVTADVGNDILILGAQDGSLVWSMPELMRAKIKSSIPGGARILDTNSNGVVDRMYFADTGGHVWRLDMSEDSSSSYSNSVLTEFARLGESDKRKFYNEPDVALMKSNGRYIYAVSIGSGYRAHPLDTKIKDMFFVLKDRSPFRSLTTTGDDAFETIKIDDLAPVIISDSSVNTNDVLFKEDNHEGWKISFPDTGEKVLATSFAFDGVITFSTLVPEIFTDHSTIDTCAAPPTHGRFYAINVKTGKAGLRLRSAPGEVIDPSAKDPSDPITDADISTDIEKGGIPGAVKVVVDSLDVDDSSCKHPSDVRIGKKLSQVTGYDTCNLESVYWSDPISDQ